jgi:hypothetical protein
LIGVAYRQKDLPAAEKMRQGFEKICLPFKSPGTSFKGRTGVKKSLSTVRKVLAQLFKVLPGV